MTRKIVWTMVTLAALATNARAQVGFPPERSPYRDVPWRQGVTVVTGWFNAASAPAGIGPQSAPLIGLRYDIQLAGPAQLTVRSVYVPTERNVLDPRQRPGQRALGTRSSQMLLNDLGISVNLTGDRSWHSLVPVIQLGAGTASDLHPSLDVGNYSFGTTFALTLGGGVRWVTGGRLEIRADVTDYLYSYRYPGTYFAATQAGDMPVLGIDSPRTRWRHNAGLTIGATWRYRR